MGGSIVHPCCLVEYYSACSTLMAKSRIVSLDTDDSIDVLAVYQLLDDLTYILIK